MRLAGLLAAAALALAGPALAGPHNLTPSSGITYSTAAPKFGSADLTDTASAGSLLTLGSGVSVGITNPGAWAMEAWIKAPASTTLSFQVAVELDTNDYLGVASNTSYAAVVINGVTLTSAKVITDNTWHHEAVSCGPSVCTLYVDGAVAGTVASQSSALATPNVAVGAYATASHPLVGYVDEVAFWPSNKYPVAFTAPTTAYAGTEGMSALYHLDSTSADSSTLPASTTYYLTPPNPASGVVANASTAFNLSTNGTLASATTVTLTDENACSSCFSPSTVTLPASATGSTSAATFTYTPTAVATHTVSASAAGLTNPASVSYAATQRGAHYLTPSSGITYSTAAPKFGAADLVDTASATSYLTLGSGVSVGITSPTAWAMEAWIKASPSSSAFQVAVELDANDYMGIQNSSNYAAVVINGVGLISTKTVTDGVWHHEAVSCGPSVCTLYVDGVSVATGAPPPSLPTTKVAVGAYADGTHAFVGYVDEVAFWSTNQYSAAFTAPTVAYAGTEGMSALYHLDSTSADSVPLSASTTYSISPPSPATGLVGAASAPFTIMTNGYNPSASSVSLTDEAGCASACFTPASVALAASSGVTSSGTFTYTPATSGAHTITGANTGGLSNPSGAPYATIFNVAVSSPALHFSPGNWKGDTGRVGSVYRQTWNTGAYFTAVWTAGASPTAKILLPSTATTQFVSYVLNGVLTAGVAATGPITLAPTANAPNTLTVFVNSDTITSPQWNNGVSTVQVDGLQLDYASTTPSAAPAPTKWAIIVGDSITKGYKANAGSDNFLASYTYQVMTYLMSAGWDVSVNASSSSGWVNFGNGGTDVPAWYYVSGSSAGLGGSYNDANSRWNKIDSGVSILDGSNQISAYGSPGTPPGLVLVNYMTNEALHASNVSDSQASVTQWLSAYRAAAPGATIDVLMPFTLEYAPKYSQSYVTALRNGVAAYLATVNDPLTHLVDYGSALATQIETSPTYVFSDLVHPVVAGHALVTPFVAATAAQALAPPAAPQSHRTFH